MSEQFIFIGRHTIKEGKLEGLKEYARKLAEIVQENEPRIIAFNIYINEEGTKTTSVQIHPDADSLVEHMQVMRQKIGDAYEFLDTDSIEFLGTPNEQVLQMARQITGSGASMSVKPHHLSGFTRLLEVGARSRT